MAEEVFMPYGKCKIYSDGSHYIAIPHTVNPHGRRRKEPVREEITVEQEISALNNGSFSEENEPVSHTEIRKRLPKRQPRNAERREKNCLKNCMRQSLTSGNGKGGNAS